MWTLSTTFTYIHTDQAPGSSRSSLVWAEKELSCGNWLNRHSNTDDTDYRDDTTTVGLHRLWGEIKQLQSWSWVNR